MTAHVDEMRRRSMRARGFRGMVWVAGLAAAAFWGVACGDDDGGGGGGDDAAVWYDAAQHNDALPEDSSLMVDASEADAQEPDSGGGGDEVCDNGVDDDSDGDTDCDDPDCYDTGSPEPSPMTGITSAHNRHRCELEPPSGGPLPLLTWSTQLETYAQDWADQMGAEGCSNIRHSGGSYGENLAWGSALTDPNEVVDLWMSEESCFSYGSFPDCCSCTCGHYTQVLWRNTTEVGCGYVDCGSTHLWVCSYNPPGNYLGQMPF